MTRNADTPLTAILAHYWQDSTTIIIFITVIISTQQPFWRTLTKLGGESISNRCSYL